MLAHSLLNIVFIFVTATAVTFTVTTISANTMLSFYLARILYLSLVRWSLPRSRERHV